MNQDNKFLNKVYVEIGFGDLRNAIKSMENYLALYPHQINADRLYAIKADYQMMIDYWRGGFKDPQAPQVLSKLRHRMYVLYGNVAINSQVLSSPQLASLFMKVHLSARDWSVQVLKERLESFVSDVAMLDLEPAHTARERRKQLYKEHQVLISEIFAHILTTDIWTDGQGEAMEDLLLSPTIDSIDQQVIVSAIMLASMNCYDMAKFRTLVNVYLKSTDEYVRQRALVGWVFSVDDNLNHLLYPEMEELVNKALKDPAHLREFVELQKQIFYCMSAEQDRETIQHEIMPDLLKAQGYNITRNGVEEKDEDSILNDILHPDEEEKEIEKMEAGFQKMVEMQRQGSDIYFGGFSQMKRYPFFNEISNWFTPYYYDHPGIAAVKENYKEIKFLQNMMDMGPFCNSDKYSFMLAFESVLNQIPKNMLELLNNGEATMWQNPEGADMTKPFYIRRIYLQDLYRFFRLHPLRSDFRNFFDSNSKSMDYMFLHRSIFKAVREESFFIDVASFLIKRNRRDDAKILLSSLSDEKCHSIDYYLLIAHLDDSPHSYYLKALELEPKNERALVGMAKVYFAEHDYEAALDTYETLLDIKPDKQSYLLNKAICLTNLWRYDEAEQILFRLNYENADDLNIARVLAWTLTGNGKYEQAGRLYNQLMASGNPTASDMSNYAFNLWFSGRIDEAANAFRSYLKDYNHGDGDDRSIISNVMYIENKLIEAKGISSDEVIMMRDWILG